MCPFTRPRRRRNARPRAAAAFWQVLVGALVAFFSFLAVLLLILSAPLP